MKKVAILLIAMLALTGTQCLAQNAEKIIERYIRVTGGIQKLSNIKKIEISKIGSGYNGEIEVIDFYQYPSTRVQHYYINGQETYHYEFDGNTGLVINNGVTTQMNYQDIALSKAIQLFMPELYYRQNNFTVEYLGSGSIDQFNGTYDKVQFTAPNGNYFVNFYDQKTGYKARIQYMDLSFEHYSAFEEIDGVVVPTEYLYQVLAVKTMFVLNDIAFNGREEDSFTTAYQEEDYYGEDNWQGST
ncbi:MAG: hypothetical protein WBA74_12410, partial [Cyclobacteriaceae bacterium]